MLLVLAAGLLAACGRGTVGAALGSPTPSTSPVPGGADGGGLFVDSTERGALPSGSQVVRHRYVAVDSTQLFSGEDPLPTRRYVLNLFPDAVFVATVSEMTRAGDTVSWSGTFAEDRPGSFTLVHTAGVYQLHAALPPAAFEVTVAGPGLYRVDEIDQTRFPQRD